MRKGKKIVLLGWIQLSIYQYGAVLFRIKGIKTLFINDNVSDNEFDNSYGSPFFGHLSILAENHCVTSVNFSYFGP